MNWLQKFLIVCSGSSFQILNRCKTEWNKHAGIGGTILFTGILAALSGGYALYMVFDNIWAAVFFGIIWGLMIFNLDRYIVSSVRKTGGRWKQFWMAFPRLIFAIVFALVISKPLELRIFQKELDKELVVIENENLQQHKKQIDDLYATRNTSANSLLKQYKSEMLKKDSVYFKRQEEFDLERLGKNSERTSGREGYGPLAKEKEKQMLEAKIDAEKYASQMSPKIDSLENVLGLVNEEKNAAYDKHTSEIAGYDGIAARMHALSRLSSKEPAIRMASIFITLLIVFLEISPIMVKLISNSGPYDRLLQNHEHDFDVYVLDRIESKNYKLNKKLNGYKENGILPSESLKNTKKAFF